MKINYRKSLFFSINILVIAWIMIITFFSETQSDFFGIFLILVVLFLILFNIYSYFLDKYLRFNFIPNRILEIVFTVMLILPFFILWILF